MWEYNYELYHHGIKGQKWYQRNYQDVNGKLTLAGRIRYGVGQGLKKTKETVNKGITNIKNNHDARNNRPIDAYSTNKEVQKFYAKVAAKTVKQNKKDRQIEKNKAEEKYGYKISNRQMKLYNEFKKKGFTEEQAMAAAKKRAKTERILKMAGPKPLAAALVYTGAKQYISANTNHKKESNNG